jgi:hypothetical protein
VLDTYTYPIIVDELHIDGQLIEDEVPAKYGDVIVLSRDYAFDNEEENEPDYMYERRMRRQARVERQPVPVQRLENVTPLNTRTVKSANLIKTCYNPLAANYENIAGEREAGVATIYIANTSNTITKALCLDEDSLTGYLRGKASIFFKCLPTVSERALYIRPEDTTQEPLRRIAFDIICYVYEKDAKKIRLGKSYIFIPSQTPVGRIVSQKVLNGNSVVSAEHCQNDYSRDYIYDIKEVIIT